jgi:hypothetical protein
MVASGRFDEAAPVAKNSSDAAPDHFDQRDAARQVTLMDHDAVDLGTARVEADDGDRCPRPEPLPHSAKFDGRWYLGGQPLGLGRARDHDEFVRAEPRLNLALNGFTDRHTVEAVQADICDEQLDRDVVDDLLETIKENRLHRS